MTKDDTQKVSAYVRRKPKSRKPEPEDGTGIELPTIAPTEGPKIVNVPPAGEPRQPSKDGGVTIIGGSQAGQRQGVKRLGNK